MRSFRLVAERDSPVELTARGLSARLERDQRTRQPRFGAIEEEAHAESFGPLHGDQAHLSANVIAILEQRNLRFIVIGVALEPLHAVFDSLAEARADFEGILQGGIVQHGRHLGSGVWPQFFLLRSQVFPNATDINDKPFPCARLRCRET